MELLPGGTHSNFLHEDYLNRIVFKRGKGCKLWDIDDNEYLDLDNKFGSQLLGHNNAVYIDFLNRQLNTVLSVSNIPLDIVACEYLKKHIPCCEMVRFSLSGTSAMEHAVLLAQAYTKCNHIVIFQGHYHGFTNGFTFKRDPCLHILPWNSVSAFDTYLLQHKEYTAAVIMEPLCMSSGGISVDQSYLKYIKNKCAEHGIIFIMDEVITGLRTGLGGLQKKYGVVPDLCVISKCLGNGIPISALCGRRKIMQLYAENKVVFSGTYNGYPLGLAALVATFKVLDNDPERLYSQTSKRSHAAAELFKSIAIKYGLELTVQGEDNCYAINLRNTPLTDYSGWTSSLIRNNSILRGCLQRYGILLSPVLRMYPSIAFDENSLDFLESRLHPALKETKSILKKFK